MNVHERSRTMFTHELLNDRYCMSFQKKINLIQLIYDVVPYKHFFRDQNNSDIPKKRKKNFFIIISKISSLHCRRAANIASKCIL